MAWKVSDIMAPVVVVVAVVVVVVLVLVVAEKVMTIE